MNCINCGTPVTAKFCPNCGQRAIIKRITFKESWFDFWSRVYGFDGMFPRTLRDLTIRPGTVAKKFIEGNRALYYGPVGYFFLMITVCLLVFSLMNIDFFDLRAGMAKSIPIEQPNPKLTEKIQHIVSDNIKVFAFFVILFQPFTAKYILFRKSGYNFLEHAVLPFYVAGHLYWVMILSGIYFSLTGTRAFLFQLTFGILFLGFAYSTFMTYQSGLKAFFKGIALYLVSITLYILTICIVAIIVMLMLAWLNPDSLDLIRPSKNT